jgi:hypothetical protein
MSDHNLRLDQIDKVIDSAHGWKKRAEAAEVEAGKWETAFMDTQATLAEARRQLHELSVKYTVALDKLREQEKAPAEEMGRG